MELFFEEMKAAGIDVKEQVRLYQRAQRILREDLPTLPHYSSDVVGGYRPHPLQYWELAETRAG